MKKIKLAAYFFSIFLIITIAFLSFFNKANAHSPTNTHQGQTYGWLHYTDTRSNPCFQVKFNMRDGITGALISRQFNPSVWEYNLTDSNLRNALAQPGTMTASTYTTPCLSYTNSNGWYTFERIVNVWEDASYWPFREIGEGSSYINDNLTGLLWTIDVYLLPKSNTPTISFNPHQNSNPVPSTVDRNGPTTLGVYWFAYEPDSIVNFDKQGSSQSSNVKTIHHRISIAGQLNIPVDTTLSGNWPEGDINLGKFNLADGAYRYLDTVWDFADNLTTAYYFDQPYIGIDRAAPTVSCSQTASAGNINVTLTENDTFTGGGQYGSGIGAGDVDVSINGGAWTDHASTIADFSFAGSGSNTYAFRYRARDNAADTSGNYNQWSGYFTCTGGGPTPPTPTACSPSTHPAINTEETATFNASGGNGTYSWNAGGGTIIGSPGITLSVSYSSSGVKNVTVTSDSQSSSCTVTINNARPQPPEPPPTITDLPGGDPGSSGDCDYKSGIYCYRVSWDKRQFILWAQLENRNDPEIYNSTADTATCNDNDTNIIPPIGGFLNYCIRSPR